MKKLDLMKLKKSISRIKVKFLKFSCQRFKKVSMKLKEEMNHIKEKLIC